jgi:hypothetical protein
LRLPGCWLLRGRELRAGCAWLVGACEKEEESKRGNGEDGNGNADLLERQVAAHPRVYEFLFHSGFPWHHTTLCLPGVLRPVSGAHRAPFAITE